MIYPKKISGVYDPNKRSDLLLYHMAYILQKLSCRTSIRGLVPYF